MQHKHTHTHTSVEWMYWESSSHAAVCDVSKYEEFGKWWSFPLCDSRQHCDQWKVLMNDCISTQQMLNADVWRSAAGGLKCHIWLSKALMHTWLCKRWSITRVSTETPVLFSSLLPFLPLVFYVCCSCSNHRATPAPQEVVCSSGWGRISPSSSPLGDRGLRLLPTEVLLTASQGAAQRRLENTHQWYPIQRDRLDSGEVRVFSQDVDAWILKTKRPRPSGLCSKKKNTRETEKL